MNKKIVLIIAIIGVIGGGIGVVACSSKETAKQPVNAQEATTNYNTAMGQLKGAKQIEISKDLVSLGKSYSIDVDGKDFGNMDGEFLNVLGDTLTIQTDNGTKISSEKQIKRWGIKLNRLAEVQDKDGKIVGYIGEEKFNDLLKIGYNFHFYNAKKEEIGYLKQQVFSFMDTFKVYDMNDKLCYEINAKFNPIRAEYVINVHDNNTIPADQVIYLTGILNSIKTSKAYSNTKKAAVGAGVNSAINNSNNNSSKKNSINSNKKSSTSKSKSKK
ncbi:MAG: hypothetical protein ACRC6T_03335 [Sarcina sp.]